VPPIPKLRQTQPNPSHFGATDSASVPPSLGCQLSVTQIHVFGPTENVGSASPRLEIWPLVTLSVQPSFLYRSHRDSKVTVFWSLRYHRDSHIGVTELVTLGVTVRFLGMPIYTPSPPPTRKRSTQNYSILAPSSFLRENHLVLCWGQDLPLQPYGSWFLASPSCFPPIPSLLPSQICERVIVCWGVYHLEAQEQGVHRHYRAYYLLEGGAS